MFTKKELGSFIGAAIVLGLLVGFDDGQPVFIVNSWLVHVISVIALALVMLLLYTLAQRVIAQKFGGSVEKSLWSLHRYSLKPRHHLVGFGIPLWLLLPLIIALVSGSKLVFAGVLSSAVVTIPRLRIGYKLFGIREFERAACLVAGPLSMMVLAIIFMGFEPSPLVLAARYLAVALALSNLLPLPKLDGSQIFFGSLPLYMFSVVLAVVTLLMVVHVNAFLALLLGVVLGATAVAAYWWKTI
ncbi:MAG TPA: hypothetical protein VJB87_01875 [Candidatus Nanoarchaeia archaeon]|nr:hypothetical protein [Candidatus Nanoarchaeia archaeon]